MKSSTDWAMIVFGSVFVVCVTFFLSFSVWMIWG